MERLTKRTYTISEPHVEMVTAEMGVNVTQILGRLCEYEDAEEDGLLVRMPCKVGDTVYVMHFMDGAKTRIEAQTVIEISNGCDGWYISTMTHGVGGIYSFDSIGIVWWLTREEAEAVLTKED